MALRTGIHDLDQALGREGFPRGRVIEIFGPESCGKTTMALHLAAQTQAVGGTVLYIDADHSLDLDYARKLGVDTASLVLSRPQSGDQAIQLALSLLRTFALDVIIVDSVAALSPEQDAEDAGAAAALHAEMMTRALRKLFWLSARSGATVFLLNHGSARLEASTEPDFTTGGHAVTLYSSIRLRLAVIAQDPVGARIRMRVVKNRLWECWPEVDLYLRYGSGFAAEAAAARKPATPETQTATSVFGQKARSAGS